MKNDPPATAIADQITTNANSVEGWALKYLEERGLWPNEAIQVIAAMKADQTNSFMRDVWGKTKDGYPVQFLAALAASLKFAAAKWIDANCPMHWARPMFTEATS